MNDGEFIELLNLYVDKEIRPEDALRLEAEVAASPERRRVYDQYCRMQRACSILAEEFAADAAARPEGFAEEVRAPLAPSMAPYLVGLAAAACLVAVIVLRDRGDGSSKAPAAVAVATSAARPAAEALEFAPAPEPMTAVFSARIGAAPAESPGARTLFAVEDAAGSQLAQLNWIQEIRMPPVRAAADAELVFRAKPELVAPVPSTAPGRREADQPAEMAAFRFQR